MMRLMANHVYGQTCLVLSLTKSNEMLLLHLCQDAPFWLEKWRHEPVVAAMAESALFSSPEFKAFQGHVLETTGRAEEQVSLSILHVGQVE